MSKKKVPAKKTVAAPKPIKVKKPVAAPATGSAFEVEAGVPVPPRTRGTSGGVSMYPFATMGLNERFFVKAEIERALYASETEADTAQAEESRKVSSRLSGAARRFTKVNPKHRFAVRMTTRDGVHGVGVWRIE